MKIFSLIVLFGIIQSTWQYSFLFNRFVTASPPPTTTGSPNTCKGSSRKWSLCDDSSPATRTTTDGCPKKTKECSKGTLAASDFINTFVPSNIPLRTKSEAILPPSRNKTFTCKYGKCYSLLRTKRQVPTIPPKRDLLFMIDQSGSVGKVHFQKAKRIVSAIIKLLCGSQVMSPHRTRVSVMSFDETTHFHVPLLHPTLSELNTDADELAGYIKWTVKYIKATGGRTCLNKALLYARDVALSALNGGRRWQQDVLQEIIILTDGCANCAGSRNIQSTVKELDHVRIKIYVIGISLSSSCQNTLQTLASKGNCYHYFHLDKWDYDLDDFVHELENPPVVNGQQYCIHQVIGSVNQCTTSI